MNLQLPSSGELVPVKVPKTLISIEGFREELFEELGLDAEQCSRLNVTEEFLSGEFAEELLQVIGKDPGEYKLKVQQGDKWVVLPDSMVL